MKITEQYAPAVRQAMSKARRAWAERSPKDFAAVYLSSTFNKPSSAMHEEIFQELGSMHMRRGSHLAIAAPRGHAKSTVVTLAYVLWVLLFENEPFVVLLSATADQSQRLLEHVKRTIETNEILRMDFPELRDAKKIRPWRKAGILLPNRTLLASYSANQNFRGVRHGEHRPTLIIADDLEDKTRVISELQRQALNDWFTSTALKAGTPETNVIIVGTVFHHESLLGNLLDPQKSPGWKGMKYAAVKSFSDRPDLWEEWIEILRGRRSHFGGTGAEGANFFYAFNAKAMESGASVLWPEMFSYRQLMEVKFREGESPFQAEFMNDPLDPAACIFARANLIYWDDADSTADQLLRKLPRCGRFFAACDPSLGKDSRRGDYSAIVIVYQPGSKAPNYVVAADIARRTPAQTISRIVEYARTYRIDKMAVEGNNFQDIMVNALANRVGREGLAVPVHSIQNRTNKVARITSLEADISTGRLILAKQHQMLIEQLKAFPLGRHDDGPDALEMVNTLANANRGCRISWMNL
ncbi:MAG: phage terminase large subunit [Phycisphaeraceae bacterium]|nr:phage terminase large subunit [Phycisphaeraceae bacterium]